MSNDWQSYLFQANLKSADPTKLSRLYLESHGYVVHKVEVSIKRFVKVDFLSFVDLIAFGDDETIAVQTTSHGNRQSRLAKILDTNAAIDSLRAGWRIEVHGWKYDAPPYNLTLYQLQESDFKAKK